MVKQLHHFLLITLRQCNELVQKVWSKNVTKYGLTIKNMILKCRLRVTIIDQTNCSLFIYSFMNPTLGNVNQKSRTFFFALEFVDPTSSFVEQPATQVEVSLRRLLYSQKWCLCFEIRCAWNPKPHLQNFNFTMYYYYIQPDQPCESRCCQFYYMHQPYVAG